MKKLLLLATVCIIASSVSAIELKPYVEGRLSNTWSKSRIQERNFRSIGMLDHTVLGGSLAVGTQIDKFRIELEGYYNDKAQNKNLFDSGVSLDLKTKGFFVNGYYDLPTIKGFTPFIGGGIGYSWLKTIIDNPQRIYKLSDTDWGYNLGGGISYAIDDNTAVTLGYRYENLGTVKKMHVRTKFEGYKLSLGLRYTF